MKVGKIFRDNITGTVKTNVDGNSNIFLLSYEKLSGPQMNTLRKDLRKVGARMYVSRNSLLRKALEELSQEQLTEKISGQTALVWSSEDSVAVSKVLVKFAESFKQLSIQGGLLDGALLAKEDVKKISELPSKEVLLAMLLGTILSPVTRFAGILNAKSRDLLSILKQLSEKKGGN